MDEATKPKRKAQDNPWYRLATLHGEPVNHFDECVAKNRETWNRWMAPRLSDEVKAALRAKGWPYQNLTPFSVAELQSLAAQVGSSLDADRIDFSNTRFETSWFAQHFVFPDANFTDAIFSGNADFFNATFSGRADFRCTTFSGRADFRSATFSVGADFQIATFDGDTDFRSATFSGIAAFASATFSSISFFTDATFSRYAPFESAKFRRDAHFENVTFSGGVAFENVTFSGYADFRSAIFSRRADFVNAEMKKPTTFDDVRFAEPPRCFNAKLHEGTTWHRVQWPKPPLDPRKAEEFGEAYERLKLEMDRLKKHGDELDFFARELQCQRVVLGWRGLPILLYGAFSGYGRSYMRPLGILVAVITLGAVPIRAHFGGGWSLATFTGHPIGGGALGLSFANTFGFLSIRKDLIDTALLQGLPGWLKVVATIQNLLGIVLLFLFGLGIRNRFRIK